jgi:hypothetical protein
VTDAAVYEGRMLRHGLRDKTNTGSAVMPNRHQGFEQITSWIISLLQMAPLAQPLPASDCRTPSDNALLHCFSFEGIV